MYNLFFFQFFFLIFLIIFVELVVYKEGRSKKKLVPSHGCVQLKYLVDALVAIATANVHLKLDILCCLSLSSS